MKGTDKRFIIISTSFAPQNRIGAVRMTKISKYLVRNGYNVVVIAPSIDSTEIIDESLISIEQSKMQIYRISHPKWFMYSIGLLRNFLLRKRSPAFYTKDHLSKRRNLVSNFMSIGIKMYQNLENELWERECVDFIQKKLLINESDILVSSYPKISAHKAALKIVELRNLNNWIADFRDPVYYDSLNASRDKSKLIQLQDKICSRAKLVTYVSSEMIHKLSGSRKDLSKFKFLPNGYDNDDLIFSRNIFDNYTADHEKKLKFVYVGSLYGGKRDLSFLFKTLKSLIVSKKIEMSNMIFYYAGKEFDVIQSQAKRFELDCILINKGYISRNESLVIQNQSDVIVVSTWNTDSDIGVVPGKLYECFLLKKPTIAITNGTVPNSELGRMVLNARLGIEVNTMLMNDDATNLSEFIQKMYNSAITGEILDMTFNYDVINKYNYENVTLKLIEYTNEFMQ